MFDFDKLGKKTLIAPFVLVIALRCVLCLAVAPLLRADPHDISLAIVNLDDGTTTPVGAVNAGEVLASQLTGEESQAAQESTETLAKLTAMKAAAASGAAAATNGAAATESSEAPNLVAVTSSDSAASTNGAVEAAEGAADSGLAAGTQAAFIVALSALIAAFALLIDVAAGGLDLPAGQLFCWLWLGCACVMLALVGLTDACLPVGALFAITVFAVGMGTAMLPAELMPTFWADWVFPWAPQAHLGQGVRTIVYCGQNPGMADAGPLMVFAVIGIAALLLAAGLATAKSAKAKDTAPAAA
ncbi:hypothetical protein [uncultured Senegalimassilia sp.]|uniref:hypothetical protein n=1 Tax=uncultured Senegalimassilia sp. TaxID=1714350 RepID=UPI002585BA09|nr:hypothetical protein [uncultured Senegalimassilia sp.]